jgi:EAL and modified HD-GYP domain-containing signal transduction protein
MVEVRFVANARNEWVALLLRPERGAETDSLLAMFSAPDLLAASAPLDCVLQLDSLDQLSPALLPLLPPSRIVFILPAASLGEQGVPGRLAQLQGMGYRVLLDGSLPPGVARPATLRSVACDCANGLPEGALLLPQFGPHFARGVDTPECFAACQDAGFTWFCGDHPLHPASVASRTPDPASRRRLLALLGLLARDADSRELEALLKQDAALSFHLLKLVNSAAFAVSTQITSFGQAIRLLGRRQLQRWLQLLLYARDQADGLPNLMLPLAALRGAQMEALCKRDGDAETQDLAFMAGVFSLIDRLFATPMAELVAELSLPAQVQAALLAREGQLGERLRLIESTPNTDQLRLAGVLHSDWWHSQLHAWHWAIQVGRNV